jgi:cellobiose-specific phosphotransferase system component IIB
MNYLVNFIERNPKYIKEIPERNDENCAKDYDIYLLSKMVRHMYKDLDNMEYEITDESIN